MKTRVSTSKCLSQRTLCFGQTPLPTGSPPRPSPSRPGPLRSGKAKPEVVAAPIESEEEEGEEEEVDHDDGVGAEDETAAAGSDP